MASIWEDVNYDTYQYFSAIKECFDSIIDEQSRNVFYARLACDLGEWDGFVELVKSSNLLTDDQIDLEFNWVENYSKTQIPVYIYGAGQFGGHICRMLQRKKVNIAGFFDQNYANISTRCDLPVLPPPTSSFPVEKYAIYITPSLPIMDIIGSVSNQGVPRDVFLNSPPILNLEHQYFEFSEHYVGNGAFIDGGCFDFSTSTLFHQWSKNNYTKIFAIEPDSSNLQICMSNAERNHIDRVEFIHAGLYNTSQQAACINSGTQCCRIASDGDEQINLARIDDIVGAQRVSFIKLDVEGCELLALQGAKETILRDKPFCALSIYHKPGDEIALMKYLKELVPEYRFALRHYTTIATETVLYAFL